MYFSSLSHIFATIDYYTIVEMAKVDFRVILAIGKSKEENDENVKKYSLDTKVEPYLRLRKKDAKKAQKQHLKYIEELINNKNITLNDYIRNTYKDMYLEVKDMSAEDYFYNITQGCTYDEKTGDAYSTENPNAYYKYERCHQHRLEVTGEEGDFSNPFILDDGTKSYVAKASEIDWEKMHMCNTEIYKAAWELVVFDREPVNDREKRIKENMKNKIDYFSNFEDCDEYVRHSCSFWTYGVVLPDGYKEVDYTISDKEWVSTFFDRFIKPLKGDEVLTIYEAKAID